MGGSHTKGECMRRVITAFVVFIVSVLSLSAQAYKTSPWEYNWPAATTTGVVGEYLILDSPQNGGSQSTFQIQVYITGTLPSACTFEVQGTPIPSDPNSWSTGSNSVSGDQSCASATILSYPYFSKNERNIRINIGTLTGADATTKIWFFYTDRGNGK